MKRRRAEAAARADKAREEWRQREAERREARRREEARMLAVMEGCQLYVGGLAIRCDDAALAAHFARFGGGGGDGGGALRDAVVIRDPETGLSRGFGFVTLADADAGREAIRQCHGREAKGLCPQHGRMQARAPPPPSPHPPTPHPPTPTPPAWRGGSRPPPPSSPFVPPRPPRPAGAAGGGAPRGPPAL